MYIPHQLGNPMFRHLRLSAVYRNYPDNAKQNRKMMIIHFKSSKFILVDYKEPNFLINEVKKFKYHIIADDCLIII